MLKKILRIQVFILLFLVISVVSYNECFAGENDLISQQSIVTASKIKPNSSVDYIKDGQASTSWESGDVATQWIMMDMQVESSINRIKLLPAQSPSGRTLNRIYIGNSISNLELLITIDQITQSGVWVDISLLRPVKSRYIKIETVESPSWIAWREIEVYGGSSKHQTNLKYYGYLSNDYNYQTATYFSELNSLNNTNIAWGNNNLGDFKNANIKVLYSPESFWTRPTTGADAGKLKLIPSWSSLWTTEKVNKIDPYIDNIYGFYMDEPYWNKITKEDFWTFTKAIHDSYPDKRIVVIEAAPPIFTQEIPQDYYKDVTDIGFDYYFTLDSTNNHDGWGKYLNYFEKFKLYTPGKDIWLVPDGYGPVNYSLRWFDSYEKYTSLAISNPQIVGMLGFIYNLPSELRAGNISLNSLLDPQSAYYDSSFRIRQIDIGQSIINNQQNNTVYLDSDVEPDGDVDYFDYQKIIELFGLSGPSGWIRADILKNGKVDIYDFNKLITDFGR